MMSKPFVKAATRFPPLLNNNSSNNSRLARALAIGMGGGIALAKASDICNRREVGLGTSAAFLAAAVTGAGIAIRKLPVAYTIPALAIYTVAELYKNPQQQVTKQGIFTQKLTAERESELEDQYDRQEWSR